MHRSTAVFGSIFCLGLLAIVWQEYYRSSRLLGVMGMSGPRANSGRYCQGIYSNRRYWSLPSRTVGCRGPSYFGRTRMSDERVVVDALTRRVVSADKGWDTPDSAAWAKSSDSVRSALSAKGARQFQCKYQPQVAPPGSMTYWRARRDYIRFSAYRNPYVERPDWLVQVHGQTQIPYECAHPPPEPNSNTCSDATLRVPLPRGYEWCWKTTFSFP